MAVFGQSTVYKAAKLTPINESWQPVRNMDADREMRGEIDEIRSRCRDLVRNNALGCAVVTTLGDYLGSTGLTPTQGDPGGMEVWGEWTERASLSGMDSWEDIGRDIISAQAETGDVLLLTPINPNKKGVQTSVELVEGDRVRTPLKFKSNADDRGRTIRHGVVFDAYGAEVGYYVCKIDPRTSAYMEGGAEAYHYYDCYAPNGRMNARLIRRPDKKRPGQTRQLPIFVAVAQQFWDCDAFWDAGISRARSLAMIAALFESDNTSAIDTAVGVDQTAGATSYTNDFGDAVNVGSIPPGAMIKIPFGTKVTTLTPSGSMDLDVLLVRSIRLMGAAMGIPLEMILRDFSETNFSAGKLAHDGFFRLVDRWNRGNARQFADPLYRLVCVEAMLRGDKRVAGLTPERLKVKWIGGPRSYNADPSGESTAEERRMNNNITTMEMICAENGKDYRDVLDSQARVLKAQKEKEIEYGLEPGSLSRKAGAGAPAQNKPDPKAGADYVPEADQKIEDEKKKTEDDNAKNE